MPNIFVSWRFFLAQKIPLYLIFCRRGQNNELLQAFGCRYNVVALAFTLKPTWETLNLNSSAPRQKLKILGKILLYPMD